MSPTTQLRIANASPCSFADILQYLQAQTSTGEVPAPARDIVDSVIERVSERQARIGAIAASVPFRRPSVNEADATPSRTVRNDEQELEMSGGLGLGGGDDEDVVGLEASPLQGRRRPNRGTQPPKVRDYSQLVMADNPGDESEFDDQFAGSTVLLPYLRGPYENLDARERYEVHHLYFQEYKEYRTRGGTGNQPSQVLLVASAEEAYNASFTPINADSVAPQVNYLGKGKRVVTHSEEDE